MGIETIGIPLAKMALGGGLGAVGGALADDPSQLSSFVDATGDPNLPGVGNITVDPGDLLAQGVGRNELLFNAIAGLAAQPTQLGPASIIQTAPFSFGGALPAPIGIGIRDPGFLQRPGIDIFASALGGGLGGGREDDPDEDIPDDGRPIVITPEEPDDPTRPGSEPPGEGAPPNIEDPPGPLPLGRPLPRDPSDPLPIGVEDPPGAMPLGFTPRLPTTIPTQRGELSQFLDAINLANMSRARPFVQGGLN